MRSLALASVNLAEHSFACTLCRVERASVLNEPCRHQFLCLECCTRFRDDNGAICNACREPSSLVLPREATSVRSRKALRELEERFKGLDAKTASTRELRLAIDATKQSRILQSRDFADRACVECGEVRALLIDAPCGHANLCAGCCVDSRRRLGDVCRRCSKPSTLHEPVREVSCNVCFDSVDACYLVALGDCAHQLCTACSVAYIRNALGDVTEHVKRQGIRCPVHSQGCESFVTFTDSSSVC